MVLARYVSYTCSELVECIVIINLVFIHILLRGKVYLTHICLLEFLRFLRYVTLMLPCKRGVRS